MEICDFQMEICDEASKCRVSKLVIPNSGAVIQTRPVQHRRCAVVQATGATKQHVALLPPVAHATRDRASHGPYQGHPQGRGGSWTERTVS